MRDDPSVDHLSLILAPLLLAKMPPSSRLDWNRRHRDPSDRFALSELQSFAEAEVDTFKSLSHTNVSAKPERTTPRETSISRLIQY